MKHHRLAALLLASLASAQSGPWTDGELIVDVANTLYRINPETGQGQLLTTLQYRGGWAGGYAFDSWRGGLLANASLPPDNVVFYRLWLIGSNGAATAIPGFAGQTLRALAPAGDGRVYYQVHGTGAIGWLDGNDVQHVLMDQTGAAPLAFPVEHLHYHAASNALLGTNSAWWSTNHCSLASCSVFRIPLSADGSRLGGAITCTSIGTGGDEIMSVSDLPGGRVLVCLSSGTLPTNQDKLLAVDAVTLMSSVWARVQVGDLNGGYFNPRLGAAVVLDDTSNLLRRYDAGGSGMGTVIPTSVPVGDAITGFSPVESIWQVDVLGPGCNGFTMPYGQGLAGSGGLVPLMSSAGCPDLNRTGLVLSIRDALGGTGGVLVVGRNPVAVPALGGTLLAFPDLVLTVALGGAAGVPGAGTLNLPLRFTDPAMLGASIYTQAALLDLQAVQWVAFSNGLRLTIGS